MHITISTYNVDNADCLWKGKLLMLVGLTKAVVVYTTKSEYYDAAGGGGGGDEQSSQAGGVGVTKCCCIFRFRYVDHG